MCHKKWSRDREKKPKPAMLRDIRDQMTRNADDLIKTRPPTRYVYNKCVRAVIASYLISAHLLLGDVFGGGVLSLSPAECGDPEL